MHKVLIDRDKVILCQIVRTMIKVASNMQMAQIIMRLIHKIMLALFKCQKSIVWKLWTPQIKEAIYFFYFLSQNDFFLIAKS